VIAQDIYLVIVTVRYSVFNSGQDPIDRQVPDPSIVTEVRYLAIIQEKIVSLFPAEELSGHPAKEVRAELLGYSPGQTNEIGHCLDSILGYGDQVTAAAGPDHHLPGLDQYPGLGSMFNRPCGNMADRFEFL